MADNNPYRGKCYQTTFEMMQSPDHRDLMRIIDHIKLNPFSPNDHLVLCHGMAELTNGKIEGHAWIEIVQQAVYDPASDHLNPYEINDFLNKFKCHNIRRLTRSELIALTNYPKLQPPWHNLTDSELTEACVEYLQRFQVPHQTTSL